MQDTLKRLQGLKDLAAPIVVCNEEHRFTVAEQLRNMETVHQGILLEPVARNTAPAIAVAARHARMVSKNDPLLFVLPADHVILNVPAFHQAIEQARFHAEQGKLVTFGILPTGPHTGYGYIRAGEHVENGDSMCSDASTSTKCEAFSVAEFIEKPDFDSAGRYIATGGYFWNSGMFMFKASSYLEELERLNPKMLAACEKAIEQASKDLDFVRLDQVAFEQSPNDSIDYAVMEKTEHSVVVPLDAAWSDVGSWTALWDIADKNEDGNVYVGDVLSVETSGCYARSDTRLISLIGVRDLVVVDTPDAIMVAERGQVQEVKKLVDMLKNDDRPEALMHKEVFRPWGKYNSIDMGPRFQVKHITLNPHATLSLQKHHHRAEHWIVVRGTAEITCDDKKFLLTENHSTYIPIGSLHRLTNPGKIPLELIEVQSGSYLGEDDIVRFDDVYGRSEENKE